MSSIFIKFFHPSKLVDSWKKNGQTWKKCYQFDWGGSAQQFPQLWLRACRFSRQISFPKKDVTKLVHPDNKPESFSSHIIILCSLNIVAWKTKEKYQKLTLKPLLSYWSTNFEINFILYFKFTCAITILYIMYVNFLEHFLRPLLIFKSENLLCCIKKPYTHPLW